MDNKTLSIVSYITLIGWLIAYFVGKEKADDLLKYHLKQSFGLMIIGVATNIASTILITIVNSLSFITPIIGLLLLVLVIIGILNAVKQEKKPLPIIGKWCEGNFNFLN